MLIVCLYPSPTLFELFSADDWMSASFHVCAFAHGQNMETLWHFSSPLSPGCCETPIKDATSSVTDQPFRTGRGGGMKGERKKASKAWWRAAGKKRGKDEDMSGMQWCNKERAVGLWLTVKGACLRFPLFECSFWGVGTGVSGCICNVKQTEGNLRWVLVVCV